MSITVVGSVAFDTIETPFGTIDEALGGAATYFSAAATGYAPVKLVGVVGQDFPQEHIDLLHRLNVDTAGLQVAEGRTFRWSGQYEYDLNVRHTLDTQLNVFAEFHPELPSDYKTSPYLFLANIDPELQYEVLQQCDAELTMMDSMDFWITGKREALDKVIAAVDIVLLNDFEMRQWAETYSLVEGARKMLATGPRAIIVKKGEHGALLVTEDEVFVAPAYPYAEVKDPTGAGDSFAGGFMGFIAQNDGDISASGLRRAVIHGAVVASFTVEDFGMAGLIALTNEAVQERYRRFQELVHYEEICLASDLCPLRNGAGLPDEA